MWPAATILYRASLDTGDSAMNGAAKISCFLDAYTPVSEMRTHQKIDKQNT